MAIGRQKQKLLVLQNLLLTETDENHKLSGQEIIDKLGAMGISVERKTIYDDIETLMLAGLDIVIERKGHANVYYVGSRLFQDEELSVLANAVASSRFLTVKKSNELIKKLQTLTSRHTAQLFKRSVYIENRAKSYNETIYYTLNSIHEAINKNKKITFKYTEYGLDKKKRLRHGGELYEVSPYYLIWDNDNYYLICYSDKHERVVKYRPDRMIDVKVAATSRRALTVKEEDLAKRLRSAYNMFDGTMETVTLEMSDKLMDVVLDRYGDSINVQRASPTTFSVKVSVQVSPTFWGWLFQFGEEARVIAPDWVKDEAKKQLAKIMQKYE